VKKRVTADRGELEEELKQLERQQAEELAADGGARGGLSPWEGLQAELRSMVSTPHAIYSRIESDTIPRADLHTSIYSRIESDAIFRADLHTSIYSIIQSDAIFRADLSYLVFVSASVCQVLTNAALGNDIVRLKHEKAAAERQIQDAREVADAVSLTVRLSIILPPSPPFSLSLNIFSSCFF
jgi:hypothetical protein